MHSRRAALCATLFAMLAGPAQAGTHWLCSLSSEGTRLICVADIGRADEPNASSPAVTAVVHGTRFPLDPARVYTVEMWNQPTEQAFVALLARSTICYRSPGCQVSLAPAPWLVAESRH